MVSNYSLLDITIFILTYNRARYLDDALNSIVNQSVKGFKIRVLDNGSTDNTKSIVEKYNSFNVEYVGSDKNRGGLYNMQRAQKIVDTRWAIVFHDDDIMHPKYIENVLEILNKIDNVSVCCCSAVLVKANDFKWSENSNKVIIGNGGDSLAALIFSGFPYPFSPVVYRSSIFKKIECGNPLYGKYNDRPFVISIADYGKCVTLVDPFVKIRIHEGQDTKNKTNNLSYQQIVNYITLYKKRLKDNNNISYKIIYYKYALFNSINFFINAKNNFYRCFPNYINCLYRAKIINLASIISGIPYLLYRIIKKTNRNILGKSD